MREEADNNIKAYLSKIGRKGGMAHSPTPEESANITMARWRKRYMIGEQFVMDKVAVAMEKKRDPECKNADYQRALIRALLDEMRTVNAGAALNRILTRQNVREVGPIPHQSI